MAVHGTVGAVRKKLRASVVEQRPGVVPAHQGATRVAVASARSGVEMSAAKDQGPGTTVHPLEIEAVHHTVPCCQHPPVAAQVEQQERQLHRRVLTASSAARTGPPQEIAGFSPRAKQQPDQAQIGGLHQTRAGLHQAPEGVILHTGCLEHPRPYKRQQRHDREHGEHGEQHPTAQATPDAGGAASKETPTPVTWRPVGPRMTLARRTVTRPTMGGRAMGAVWRSATAHDGTSSTAVAARCWHTSTSARSPLRWAAAAGSRARRRRSRSDHPRTPR